MPEVLYTGQLTGPALKQLINDCTFQGKAYFLGEQLPTEMVSDDDKQNLMCFTLYSSKIPFDNYTTGRVFQEDSELRWEYEGKREEKQFRIVYLGREQNAKVLQNYGCKEQTKVVEHINRSKVVQKKYFLFGKFLEKLREESEGCKPYAEARIARILYYPPPEQANNTNSSNDTKPATRVGIKVAEYIDSESGQIFAYRFQSLQAMD